MTPREPTKVGVVQDVKGATVTVELAEDTVAGLSFVDGEGYRVGQVGNFVRIPLGHVDLYGVVTQVGAGAAPATELATRPYGNRWLQVQLVGEGRRGRRFERGVSRHPSIDDPVHLVTEADLRTIYGGGEPEDYVSVGHLASAEAIPALVDINRLVTRHSAVLGMTGAGKSTTVAGLLTALSSPERYPSARIIVLDVHGEYSRALADRCTTFRIAPREGDGSLPLHIPYWALNFDELLRLTLGNLEPKDAAPVQDRLQALKLVALQAHGRDGLSADRLSVDAPVPFSIHQLWYDLHCEMAATHLGADGKAQSRETWALEKDAGGALLAGNPMAVVPPTFRPQKNVKEDPDKVRLSSSPLSIRRQVDALGARLRDSRFDFLFRPGPWLPALDGECGRDLDELLLSWVGGPRPITILDLSGIPSTVLTDLIGVLLRILYDALFWARNLPEGGRERPLLAVLEEAHAYLGKEQSGPAAAAVRRMAKEGRKYGVGLMLVSQRPSEIDATILSQCGTLFAMRLANEADRGHVTGAASDHLKGLFDMLPVLRTGEAIIVGEAVSLPIRALITSPRKDRRPDSVDPRVAVRMRSILRNGAMEYDGHEGPGGWNQRRDPQDYASVVRQWRMQSARPSAAPPGSVPPEQQK